MTLHFVDPHGSGWHTPNGCTFAQAADIAKRTTISTYSDGDTDYIVVTTICGGSAAIPQPDERGPSFWYDGNWIDWVAEAYPDWTWVNGSGGDGAGPWFAQQQDSDLAGFLYVALGRRPCRRDEEDVEDENHRLID